MPRPPRKHAASRIALGLALMLLLGWSGQPARAEAPSGSTRLIVRFTSAPVASGGDVAATAAELAGLEAGLAAQLPGAVVERSYAALFAGAAVRVPGDPDQAAAILAARPEVAEVYEDIAFEPALQASAPAIGADALWAELGGRENAGGGVTIAVLDSGIDPSHPMFAPEGWSYPAGYPRGDSRYTTPKVIAARLYVRSGDPPVAGESSPVPGAAGSPHGTAMAGVAAGNVVTATLWQRDVLVSGVAPGAWLMNYRIFYPNADGVEVAYAAEVLAAIEDAVADGADVLLLAWSSAHYTHPLRSAVAVALDAAMDAGITVVAAASNAGPETGSATRLPGGIPRVLTVGAVTKGERVVHNLLDVTAPAPVPANLQDQAYEPTLFGGVITDTWQALPLVHVQSVASGGSPYACSPLPPDSLSGTVAVVQRGDCYVADKAFFAQQAGAAAAIIVNTDETTPAFACAGTHCATGAIGIPSVTVSKSTGDALTAWTTLHPGDAEVILDGGGRLDAETAGVVWEQSARGPAYGMALKPDLVAPGVDVLTAGHLAGAETWLQVTGTSVAAAQAAGAAALLRQAHPTWDHDAIKAALVGSADASGLTNDDGFVAGPQDRGAGHLRVDSGLDLPVLVTPSILNAPRVQPGGSHSQQVTLTNVSGVEVTVTPTLTADTGLSADLPSPITLPPGSSQSVTVTLRASSSAQGDLFGQITCRASAGMGSAQMPVWAYVEPPLALADVLIIDNDFSNFDGHRDYVDAFVGPALTAAGWSYAVWRADERCGSGMMATTLPDLDTLARYPSIIWVTGDNPHPDGYFAVTTPLTLADQQRLIAYLEGGGRLLALGQNLAQASDINSNPDPSYGRSDLYHGYLGARWIQGSLFAGSQPPSSATAVSGAAGTFLAGVALDLGPVGDGEGNQTSIDEIAPGGDPSGSDADVTACIAGVVGGQPQAGGCVAVAVSEEPSLERVEPLLAYRSAYLSFGFEGINDRSGSTSRAALMGRLMDWLTDEVAVTVPDQIGAPWEVTTITCEPTSSAGAAFQRFRWRVGEGAGAREYGSAGPSLAVVLEGEGWHPVAVEACDAWGHCAVGSGAVRAIAGGSSTLTVSRATALWGQELTYTLSLHNTAAESAQVTVTLPLPEHTIYQSHTAGAWDGSALRWAGTLAPGQETSVHLVVQVSADAPGGAWIVATAAFDIDGNQYTRSARTQVVSPLYLPWIARGG